MKVLFIHPRRGLFQLTRCSSCGYIFECENCDSKLTTYRQFNKSLELVCHQCQTYYSYPATCPECSSRDIYSAFGGVDDLVESLETELGVKVKRLDKKNTSAEVTQNPNSIYKKYNGKIFASTRIFDPSLDYKSFDKIVFIQAENLLANLDYLVQEEVVKSLHDLLNAMHEKTELVVDTNTLEIDLFQKLKTLDSANSENLASFHLNFLEKEKEIRNLFGFPPYKNLILITSQEPSREKSWKVIKQAKKELVSSLKDYSEVKIGSPYPARFLKRKNKYSFHLLLKFPRQYKDFAKLRHFVTNIGEVYKLQVRLNPRHLF